MARSRRSGARTEGQNPPVEQTVAVSDSARQSRVRPFYAELARLDGDVRIDKTHQRTFITPAAVVSNPHAPS
jgi:hypothetical protein